MNTVITHFGKVDKSGVLKINNRHDFDRSLIQLAPLAKDFTEVEIIVRKKRSRRSLDQNAFFHSWINLLSNYTGYSFDQMKNIVKYKFLKAEAINEKTGEIYEYIKETSSLNKSDFADFCTEIQHWSKDTFNLILPVPGENWTIKFE